MSNSCRPNLQNSVPSWSVYTIAWSTDKNPFALIKLVPDWISWMYLYYIWMWPKQAEIFRCMEPGKQKASQIICILIWRRECCSDEITIKEITIKLCDRINWVVVSSGLFDWQVTWAQIMSLSFFYQKCSLYGFSFIL